MTAPFRLLVALGAALILSAGLSACDSNSTDLSTAEDIDGDDVVNADDNCPFHPNPGQGDLDTDGFGDPCDCDRTPSACLIEAITAENCANGVDDDGDGRADAADPNCVPEDAAHANCGDGVDNDGDRFVDCAEPDCVGQPGCPGAP